MVMQAPWSWYMNVLRDHITSYHPLNTVAVTRNQTHNLLSKLNKCMYDSSLVHIKTAKDKMHLVHAYGEHQYK